MNKKLVIINFVLFNLSLTFSQNSLLLNANFESTTWPDITWMTQTNTGANMIADENDAVFTAINVHARSGSHFAYIGGGQNAKGRYEGSLAQEFEVPYEGNGHLTFYYRYIRESVDPGSYVKILIDGNEIWSIAPHFIVDAEESYVQVQINMGHLSAGPHTFELKGYEFPAGGDLPMQFAFDDVSFMVASTASVDESSNNNLNIIMFSSTIQLTTSKNIDQDVVVEITDLSGKTIFSNRVFFGNSYTIIQPPVVNDIYIVSLKTNQKIFTQKIYLN
jgi:hypothetical protein